MDVATGAADPAGRYSESNTEIRPLLAAKIRGAADLLTLGKVGDG
jgi:hypothetical protein